MLKTVVLTGLLFVSTVAFTNHILGGEVTYSHLQNKKYKFQLKLYRNCQNCEFNSGKCADIKNLDIYLSPEVSVTAQKLGTIDLVKLSRKSITPNCAYSKSFCDGGSYPLGIEEWIWEGEFDFGTLESNNCKFEIGIRVEAREEAYGMGSESFYNFTRLNICNGLSNSSPTLNSPAFFILPFNQSFTYNPLVVDSDKDSISYKLVKAQKNFNTNISYPVMFDELKPLSVLSPGGNYTLDKKSWPINGIGIDEKSGWMGFTPQVNKQKGFIVLQITEWRKVGAKMEIVGVTRRDLQFEVVDVMNNSTRITPSQSTVNACEGDAISLDFGINDVSFLGKTDTVDLKVFSGFPNSVIGKVAYKPNIFDAYFTADVPVMMARKQPYYITIVSNDNHCPLQNISYRTVEILVWKKPDAKFSLNNSRCNKLECTSLAYSSNDVHSWYLLDSLGFVTSSFDEVVEFEVAKPGKYFIVHQVSNTVSGCLSEELDSIVIGNFSLMQFSGKWPDVICSNTKTTLTADITGGIAPFDYFWDGKKSTNVFNFTLNRDTSVVLNIVDSKGCELEYQKFIKVFPLSELKTTDTTYCYQAGVKVPLNVQFNVLPVSNQSEEIIKYTGNGMLYKSNNDYEYEYEAWGSGINKFYVHYQDNNFCHYSDSFSIHFEVPLETGISPIENICDNHVSLDLNSRSGCILQNGIWLSKQPNLLNNGQFFPILAGEGVHKVYYSNSFKGCTFYDSTTVKVLRAPIVKINADRIVYFCENSTDMQFVATPLSGQWFNASSTGMFSASQWFGIGKRVVVVKYFYSDPTTGCNNTDTIVVNINPKPTMTAISTSEICAGDVLGFNLELSNTTKLTLEGDWKAWEINRFGSFFRMTSPQPDIKTQYCGQFVLEPLQGCNIEKRDLCITVKQRPDGYLVSNKIEGCIPFVTDFRFNATNSHLTPDMYEWIVQGRSYTGTDKFSYTFKTAAWNDVKIKYSLNGCAGVDKIFTVKSFENIKAVMGIEPKSRVMTTDYPFFIFSDASVSNDQHSVQWSFENASPSISGLPKVQVAFPRETGTYYVQMITTTNNGCEDKFASEVKIVKGFSLFIPSGFTPDHKGPQANEKFMVVTDSCEEFLLVIRNKWNEVLFRTNNQNEGWDGNYMGKPAQAGVYIYTVSGRTIYSKYFDKSGNFTLIR